MAISLVNSWSEAGSDSLAVSPNKIGDLMILFGGGYNQGLITAISGGGVTTWTLAKQANNGFSSQQWYGIVTATGSSTITVTGLNTPGGISQPSLAAYQFTGGTGTWALDGSGGIYTNFSAPTSSGTYPSLSPAGANELYFGEGNSGDGYLTGSTSGFTYNAVVTDSVGYTLSSVYNTAVSNPNAYAPAWSASSFSGNGTSITAQLYKFTLATSLPPRITGLPAAVRRANNYFRRENGLWEPERGLIVPRVA